MTQHENHHDQHRTAPADLSTVTTSATRRYRGVGALALVAAVAVSTSACGAITEAMKDRSSGHTKAFSYDSGADGKADEGLPSWVPDGASDVRGVFRTTGDEMILTMDADVTSLPAGCTSVDADHPLVAAPTRGTLSADDYRTDSTLEASWWTTGQEQDASLQCGGWWVGTRNGALFAFTPELKAVKIEDQPDPA
ncbi:hypothetical protein [Krasilnikoviella flava]|uniref:Uncharacterized protein n=1 Tax=Krasilnikoviella flava TaxID=526729 RepID=A0A1T5K9K4_9MICO|nr:hypothetical protein [Krasilnikoviella flava]SKC60377.1 hypothetical protein SAMN04324258_1966 [Krasilnikoviella flava]